MKDKREHITPYSYVECRPFSDIVMNEMEINDGQSIYEHFYHPITDRHNEIARQINHAYVCDASFLTTTGTMITHVKNAISEECCKNEQIYEYLRERKERCAGNGFHDTYQYFKVPDEITESVDTYGKEFPWMKRILDKLSMLNHSPQFLQLWAGYMVGSPMLALVTPIFFMILPFFMLKLMRTPITFENYVVYLKHAFSKHAIGKLFNLQGSSISQKAYILITFSFYVLNMMRNVNDCYRFLRFQPSMVRVIYQTIDTINDIKKRLLSLLSLLSTTLKQSYHQAYARYVSHLETVLFRVDEYESELHELTSKLGKSSYPSVFTIGNVLASFYRIHQDDRIRELYNELDDFLGYYETILSVYEWCECKQTNYCVVEWSSKWEWDISMLMPIALLDEACEDRSLVKNSIDLSKNWILTGTNASGKTTILRSVFWNQIVAQQWGIYFAERATCPIINHFYCYLNVPDSFSRDSLFQAEARRCLEVLTEIDKYPEETHFCIFDELYSGTNPVEATCGSVAYIHELMQRNIRFMMTTHYHDVVKYTKSVHKAHMIVEKGTYTYRVGKGCNRDYGAVAVFEQLGYSSDFVRRIKKYVRKLG